MGHIVVLPDGWGIVGLAVVAGHGATCNGRGRRLWLEEVMGSHRVRKGIDVIWLPIWEVAHLLLLIFMLKS